MTVLEHIPAHVLASSAGSGRIGAARFPPPCPVLPHNGVPGGSASLHGPEQRLWGMGAISWPGPCMDTLGGLAVAHRAMYQDKEWGEKSLHGQLTDLLLEQEWHLPPPSGQPAQLPALPLQSHSRCFGKGHVLPVHSGAE